MQDNQTHQENVLEQKKVVHLITKGTPMGGAQHYVYTLATSLPIKKFTSIVLTGFGDELPHMLERAGIHVERIQSLARDVHFFSDVRALWEVTRMLQKIRPDILHTNSSKAGLLGAIAGRIAGVPRIIFTGHAWVFNEHRPWVIKKFFVLLQWITLALSDHTIIVSKKAREDIRHFIGVRSKSSVVHNGLIGHTLHSKNDSRDFFTHTYGISHIHTTLEVLWIGTLSELHTNKGIDLTLEALAGITHLPWIYIVCGEGEKRSSLEKKATTLGISERVFFVGNVSHARQFLNAFDIFTLTSRTENLPYALIEAGYAKLPVLATRVGGISEIVDDQISGILTRPLVHEIRDALTFLIENKQKRRQYGDSLYKKISRDFSIDHMIEQTIRVYDGKY